MNKPAPSQARRFARVAERLPLRLRVVSADEAAELSRRIRAQATCEEPPLTPPQADEAESWERAAFAAILHRLGRLEAALDQIAGAVGAQGRLETRWIDGETTCLSGSGMAVRTADEIDHGAFLEIDLLFPGNSPASVRALGQVVFVSRADGETVPVGRVHLGVAFTAIHESDRQAVVRHTFRLQRAQLRERRADGSLA
jgi:hypothetical protein